MKTLVITGAGKGIGEAVVREILRDPQKFSENGLLPRMLLCSRTEADLLKLKKAAEAASIQCEVLALDLVQAPTAPIEEAIRHFGRIDQLIHFLVIQKSNVL